MPQEYYFGIDARNGVVIGLAGACKGERRKLSIPSALMSRDPKSMYIELNTKYLDLIYIFELNTKYLDFVNNTLLA